MIMHAQTLLAAGGVREDACCKSSRLRDTGLFPDSCTGARCSDAQCAISPSCSVHTHDDPFTRASRPSLGSLLVAIR